MQSDPQTSSIRARAFLERLEARRLLSAGQLDSIFGNAGAAFAGLVPGGECNAAAVGSDGEVVLAGDTGFNGGDVKVAIGCLKANGAPDLLFGGHATITTQVAGGNIESISAVAVQHDGRIIVAGGSSAPNRNSTLFVARFLRNGTLDPSFGVAGVLTIPELAVPFAGELSLAIIADGRIVIGATVVVAKPSSAVEERFGLARLNSSGELDKTFGKSGLVVTAVGAGVESMAVQRDGRIIVAGGAVARYNSNGTLDTTFGQLGIAKTNLSAERVALQPDESILIGTTSNTIARLTHGGALDQAFGTSGIVDFPHESSEKLYGITGLLVRPDGDVVAAANGQSPSEIGAFFGDDTLLAGFTPNGKVDPTFGTRGVSLVPPASLFGSVLPPLLQPDGKVIVPLNNFVVRRFTASGNLDPAFGYHGQVLNPFGISGTINAMVTEPDGKILVAGSEASPAPGYPTDAAVARYNADGSLDTTFATRGLELVQIGSDAAFTSIALARNSDIILGGYGQSGSTDVFAVVRLYYNGYRNRSFGAGGVELTSFGGASGQRCTSIALQANGDILAAGSTLDSKGNSQQMAVARYLANGAPDPSFGIAGQATFKPGGKASGANSMIFRADGRIVLAGSIGSDLGVALLRHNGTIDPTFGIGGATTTAFSNAAGPVRSTIAAVAENNSGQIMVVGNTSDFMTVLARYLPDGKPDPSFGSGGSLKYESLFQSFSVALQSNGKIIVGGNNRGSSAVGRLNANGNVDSLFGANGVALLSPLVTSPDEPILPSVTALAIQPDGKTLAAAGSDLFRLLRG